MITANPNTGDLVEEVLVKVSEKEEYKASIVDDRSTDVAVLKIDLTDFAFRNSIK